MSTAARSAPAEKRLGEPGDFPGMSISEHAGPKGPIYRIQFLNREFGTPREFVLRLIAVSLLSLFLPLLIAFGMAAEAMGVNWILGIIAYVVVLALVGRLAYRGGLVQRAIELDMGEDRLRVLEKGRTTLERQLSRMANITVEPHPGAEYELRLRQETGNKTISDIEKQHCLMGWFGPRGGEQVRLLCRAEWPNRKSLFQVQQAILWTIEQAAEAAAPDAVRQRHIRPPLD